MLVVLLVISFSVWMFSLFPCSASRPLGWFLTRLTACFFLFVCWSMAVGLLACLVSWLLFSVVVALFGCCFVWLLFWLVVALFGCCVVWLCDCLR